MIKQQTALNRYLITPSLLNSWLYIWECVNSVKETENDLISLEDKQEIAMKNAIESFKKTLERLPSEPNKYMQAGIDFEKECYEGKTCVSPIIMGGCFQVVGKKNISVDDMDFLMYGRLDVLKGGVIYDIKRVFKYQPQKYINSAQHGFYLELFPQAKKFEYLAFDGNKLHIETYYPDECKKTSEIIKDFIKWLKENNLLELYKTKWICVK